MPVCCRSLFALLMLLVLAGCATHAATSGRVVIKDDRAALDIRFSAHDRELIHDYYAGHRGRGLPPGLAKRGQLPRGLAKREQLPPGLRGDPLPFDLERRLARLPEGYVRLRIGRDIVLMNERTRVVFDILYAVAE